MDYITCVLLIIVCKCNDFFSIQSMQWYWKSLQQEINNTCASRVKIVRLELKIFRNVYYY